ncbi:AAA family ATPase [Ramlibacter tataouinensis]|uniref:UDP-N-acetylglucosamine kinase n=1 Tax=Ramlibacter tataouinensis (strain ATCC BAA-407 / DSM 14655 / LMG 21543 / TTB310) TaxID=365046 RepID=F5Y3A7_RAMTT|nr:AAA family ATPase [Ramlibacter tataouinensis]AEG91194.1 Conserved hypothetical protein [Ramlibacter tataouinensis TTB310]
MPRPVLYVLAGVNGAGKSSVGGHLLTRAGLAWFNPDTFARELAELTACDMTHANGLAWQEGMRRLQEAVRQGHSHAFETTLAGRSMPAAIREAARTHDVLVWFCGLPSPEAHIARVKARVAAGGHDIPEPKIRERYPAALENLIALLPHLAALQLYDNSATVAPGEAVPEPRLLAHWHQGRLLWPAADDLPSLQATPPWARPVLEAALSLSAPA